MLSVERLKRAAARLPVVIERGVDNLGKQLSGCPQAGSRPPIHGVQRLAQNKLAARLAVADIDRVMDRTVACGPTFNDGSRGARIDATNYDVRRPELMILRQTLRHRLPIRPPKDIQPVYQDDPFI